LISFCCQIPKTSSEYQNIDTQYVAVSPRAGFHAGIVYELEEAIKTADVSGVWERIVKKRIEIAYFQKVHGPSAMEAVRKLP